MFASFRLFLFSACGAAMLGLSSCGDSQQPAASTSPDAAVAPAAKPAAAPVTEARYECPMGCAGSQSAKPGKCPVCEMELEKKS
ncbi:hypothetical protein MON38_16870 [Hymenobacter sp. DH14]|uniref:Heavy metal binding domain-containing protein n=1 Tax=Hymenobacter cyanobacteriorum TaxID=2926463 RepID=A0A9X2AJQ3_9BACT|nr:heavy metal-binding domain-containing protein [Hymenobacter cyanobacteriorum]MCI1189099.1 hypothetical protein [Hymenobacter cyanobacteriorum]